MRISHLDDTSECQRSEQIYDGKVSKFQASAVSIELFAYLCVIVQLNVCFLFCENIVSFYIFGGGGFWVNSINCIFNGDGLIVKQCSYWLSVVG